MSARISYKKQTIFGIMLIILGFSIVEGLARSSVYFDPPCLFMDSDAYAIHGYEYKREMCYDNINYVWSIYPSLSLKPDQHFETININEYGFRGPEITKEKQGDTYRIIFIGGSTAFAGSADETTIAGYLQKEFDEQNPELKIEIINAGIINAFSFTETNYVKEKLMEFKPDMIIAYNGINDLLKSYDSHSNVWSNNVIKEQIANVVRENYKVWNTPVVIRYLLEVEIPNEINKNNVIPFDDEKIDQKVSLWKERWSEVCNLGKEDNTKTLIILQPMLGTSDRSLGEYERQLYDQLDKEQYFSAYEKYANNLESLKESCADTYDFRNIFENISDPLYYDKYHVGDKGNKILAEQIHNIALSKIEGLEN
jgi:hypothetical protein